MKKIVCLFALVQFALTVGCVNAADSNATGGGGSSGTSSNSGGNACTPGRRISCTCDDGSNGAQTCNDDGASYGECHCNSSTSTGPSASSSSGAGGSGDTGSYTVEFKLHAYAYHLFCYGAEVDAYSPDVPDQDIDWDQAWQSFGHDAFGPTVPSGQTPPITWIDYDVVVTVPNTSSLRAQCYINTAGSETSGDNVRYAFSDPSQFQSGEWVQVNHNGNLVYPPSGPTAFLVPNLAPQGYSENIQVNPGP